MIFPIVVVLLSVAVATGFSALLFYAVRAWAQR